jgi:hypothetical protein
MTILDNFKKLFKKEDYTLEVITSVPGVHEYGNVDLAKKILPPWFKNLPNTLEAKWLFTKTNPFKNQKAPTVKYCPSFQEIYTKGIILTAWSDMKFAIHPDGVVNMMTALPVGRDAGSHHLYIQRVGWMKNMTHYKIHSPYWFKTPQYRRFLWSGAYQHNDKLINNNIYVVTGIIDYFTQYATEINLLFPVKEETYYVEINHGDPLVHLLPLDENPIKIKKTLLSGNEDLKFRTPHPLFIGNSKLYKSKIPH